MSKAFCKKSITNRVSLLILILVGGCSTSYTTINQRYNYISLVDIPVAENVKHEKDGLHYIENTGFFNLHPSLPSIFEQLNQRTNQDNVYFEGYFESYYFPFLLRSSKFEGREMELKRVPIPLTD